MDSESVSPQTYWNGERCAARRVMVRVGDPPRPTWWFASLVGTERPAVEIAYEGEKFLIDDENGAGWRKVTSGRGSPHLGHKSLCGEVIRELEIANAD